MACVTSSWFAPKPVVTQAAVGAEVAAAPMTTSDLVAPHDAPVARPPFADWLRAHLPTGGRVDDVAGALEVVHTVAEGDTVATIAKAYLDLTDVYLAKELAAASQSRVRRPASRSGRCGSHI